MKRVLECSDSELVDRAQAALTKAGLEFVLKATDEDGLAGRQVDVNEDDSAAAVAVIERIGQALESENSPLRCNPCGTGMLAVEPPPDEAGEKPLYAASRCPNCGAPGLRNIW